MSTYKKMSYFKPFVCNIWLNNVYKDCQQIRETTLPENNTPTDQSLSSNV